MQNDDAGWVEDCKARLSLSLCIILVASYSYTAPLPFQRRHHSRLFIHSFREKRIASTCRLARRIFWIGKTLVEDMMRLGDDRVVDIPNPVPPVQGPMQGVNTCIRLVDDRKWATSRGSRHPLNDVQEAKLQGQPSQAITSPQP